MGPTVGCELYTKAKDTLELETKKTCTAPSMLLQFPDSLNVPRKVCRFGPPVSENYIDSLGHESCLSLPGSGRNLLHSNVHMDSVPP